MAEQGIKFIGDMQRLSLEAGDVLVASVDMVLSKEQHDLIKAEFARQLPGHKVLVLGKGVRLGVVAANQAA